MALDKICSCTCLRWCALPLGKAVNCCCIVAACNKLYAGRTICKLHLAPGTLHADVNGDGVVDHVQVGRARCGEVLGRAGFGEVGQVQVCERGRVGEDRVQMGARGRVGSLTMCI